MVCSNLLLALFLTVGQSVALQSGIDGTKQHFYLLYHLCQLLCGFFFLAGQSKELL